MQVQRTRRGFLIGSGCLCGGVALDSWLRGSAFAAEKPAVWPVSCRDAILRPTGHKDCWAALRAVGAEGVEGYVVDDLTLPALFHPTTRYTVAHAAGIERLAADAAAAGQRITAFCMFTRFEGRPEFEVGNCTKMAVVAQRLRVPTIRIDAVPEKLARDAFLKLSIDALKRILTATESTGVTFAIENHGTTTNDPAFLRAILDGVGSQRLGVTLDTANFYWFGHPLSKLYELYEMFAPRVFHTHCKSIRYPAEMRDKPRPMGWRYAEFGCPITEGDIDFVRIANILRKAGYRNDLCVENEFLGKLSPVEATRTLRREIELLKQIRSRIS